VLPAPEKATFYQFRETDTLFFMSEELKGLIVPVLTPFDAAGKIDEDAFVLHLGFLAQHDIRRILLNGTTGEFFSLLPKERLQLLKLARKNFRGLIVLHAGGLGLEQNKIEVHWANDFGADAVAVLPPVYPAGLPADGIIEYFNALQREAEVPFILYNFPKHTGNALSPEILQAVPHFSIKDSARNLELMKHTPRYFIGSSSDIYGPVQEGAAGFVSATANVRPELYSAMDVLVVSARVGEAVVMQQEIRAYSEPFSTGGIPLLKQTLARKLPGYPTGVRYPLV
jgi:4-hydroxy-tetrahydrodipicolinate synthase